MTTTITAEDLAVGTFPAVQPFSANYDLTELLTVPSERAHPCINEELYSELVARDPQSGSSSKPIVLRRPGIGSHFVVYGDPNVAGDELELPEDLVSGLRAERFPESLEFMIATPEHTVRLQQLSMIGNEVLR
jgi:hypothetical protein